MHSICLYCGARSGRNPAIIAAAQEFGMLVAAENWRLVYGAGDTGLMGKAAQAANDNSGTVFGVIPQHLVDQEVAKTDLSSLVITESMHERKKVMFMNSDAAVALPGGLGTLDEFFEIITWRQLSIHDKPVILLNCEHYWEPLLRLIDKLITEGFADADIWNLFSLVESPEEAVAKLRILLS
ncbi:MAG: TIGR00730 family Rossman fold protein [Rhodobacteraceae bacterium]|nr:TIGR00730 family Rossman fold protein [Paracoccaceae bacterium]MCY4198093.1 TIGR00730 family Rossman fold protein [Paracoccaceae bacterium]MCY4328189.1 TIGR00730 family Rossman fold protein [Paracoccaceae bacterium]